MQFKLGEDREYLKWLAEVKEKIRTSQLNAILKVNQEMLQLYWEIGQALDEKLLHSEWGDKVIPQLAKDLGMEFKGSGFGTTQLKYFRRWYQFYASVGQQSVDPIDNIENQLVVIGQQPVDQLQKERVTVFPGILGRIPWGHHIKIFTKAKTVEEALFYIQETITYNWSRKKLEFHIEEGLFYKKGKAHTNFEITLPKSQSDLAREMLKNPYNLGFLDINEESSERDLENAIIKNIIGFLQEVGPWFALIGRQYKLRIGEQDYYLDLLFYHTRLHCYLVVELKISEFIPEYAGKLEFYINAIDEQLRLPEDNQTIGLLLCKSANKVIVEYSLKTKTKPIGVAAYTHTLPKELIKELPAVNDLKKELQKEIILPGKAVSNKLSRVKELINRINTEEAREEKSDLLVLQVYRKVYLPMIEKIKSRCESIQQEFHKVFFNSYQNQHQPFDYMVNDQGAELPQSGNVYNFTFFIRLEGLKKAGVQAFDIQESIGVYLERFKYYVAVDQQPAWVEKLYHQIPDESVLDEIADQLFEKLLNSIEDQVQTLFPEA